MTTDYKTAWEIARANSQDLAAIVEQHEAVCRYLRGEVERYRKAYCAGMEREINMLAEVERLGKANALLVCENMRLEGEFQEFTKPGIYARLVVRKGEPRLMDCDEEYDTTVHPGESWQTEGYDVELEELRKEFIHNGMMGCMHYSNSLYKNCSGLIFCRECYPQYDEEPWEFPTNWHDIEHYPNICRRPDHVSMGVAWSCRECARRMLIDVHQIILRRYREWKPVGESWQTEEKKPSYLCNSCGALNFWNTKTECYKCGESWQTEDE